MQPDFELFARQYNKLWEEEKAIAGIRKKEDDVYQLVLMRIAYRQAFHALFGYDEQVVKQVTDLIHEEWAYDRPPET